MNCFYDITAADKFSQPQTKNSKLTSLCGLKPLVYLKRLCIYRCWFHSAKVIERFAYSIHPMVHPHAFIRSYESKNLCKCNEKCIFVRNLAIDSPTKWNLKKIVMKSSVVTLSNELCHRHTNQSMQNKQENNSG